VDSRRNRRTLGKPLGPAAQGLAIDAKKIVIRFLFLETGVDIMNNFLKMPEPQFIV
jgi:hypothetical protein